MPPWMQDIAEEIERATSQPVNHCIIIKYSDAKIHYAPPHSDKLDKLNLYGFFNFSFGVPRKFVVAEKDDTRCCCSRTRWTPKPTIVRQSKTQKPRTIRITTSNPVLFSKKE